MITIKYVANSQYFIFTTIKKFRLRISTPIYKCANITQFYFRQFHIFLKLSFRLLRRYRASQ